MQEHTIVIGAGGAVTAMHNDNFNLGFLGRMTIERASEIKWDEENQNWGIWFAVGGEFVEPSPEYGGFDSYNTARDFEVAVMNHCMAQDLSPVSPQARRWAATHRR